LRATYNLRQGFNAVFHKRNPGAPFPGAQNEGQSASPVGSPSAAFVAPAAAQQQPQAPQPQANNGFVQPRPAGVREYAYNSRQPQQQQAQPHAAMQQQAAQTSSNPNTNASTQQRVITNNNSNEGQVMSNENNTGQANPTASRPMDIPGTMPYGRPMAPGAMGFAATSHTAAYNPYGSGRKLIIGEGITMSGEIEHCDHLIVEGTVQATLKDAKLLDISEAGVFYGTVDIEEATIAGRFEGDINVNGRLTVKATGTITGSIRYKELAVEAGASIEGSLSPVGPRKGDDNIAAADFSKGKAVAKQARDAAQKSGEQLPFGDKGNAVSAAQ